MKLVYEDAKYFRDILKALETCVHEATFQVTSEGLFFKGMDPSRVAMVELRLPKYVFYEFENVEEKRFTVSLEYLTKTILKNIYKDDRIRLELSQDNDKLLVVLESDMAREFSVNLLENPEPEDLPPNPNIAFTCMVKVTLEGLKKILEDTTETIKLIADTESLTFTSDSDLSKFSVRLTKGSDCLLSIETHEAFVKSIYSITYLKEFVKALKPLGAVAEICYAKDMPMSMKSDLKGEGSLTFWLAPRIEEEEEPLEEKETETMENIPEQQQEATEIEPKSETETVETSIPQETVATIQETETPQKEDEPQKPNNNSVLCLHCDQPAIGICPTCQCSVCKEHAKTLHSHSNAIPLSRSSAYIS